MSKQNTKFSPEHVASVIQVGFPLNHYQLIGLELINNENVTEKIDESDYNPIQMVRKMNKLLGLTSKKLESDERYLIATCEHVDHAEEHSYGLKVFLKNGDIDSINIHIANFKQSEN